jgi:hypothetical protein
VILVKRMNVIKNVTVIVTKKLKGKIMWTWLRLSKFFNKIGNYFYFRHVQCVKRKQGR